MDAMLGMGTRFGLDPRCSCGRNAFHHQSREVSYGAVVLDGLWSGRCTFLRDQSFRRRRPFFPPVELARGACGYIVLELVAVKVLAFWWQAP